MSASSQSHTCGACCRHRFYIPRLPRSAVLSVILLLSATSMYGQTSEAWTLLKNIQSDYNHINDYVANISASLNIPGLSVPAMKATIYYRKPDQLHIESERFAMLPRDVLLFHPSMFEQENYDAILQGEAKIRGVRCRKIRLLATSDTTRLQRIELYVDPIKREILRIETLPGDAAPVSADFTYTRFEKYSLPSVISVEMNSPAIMPRSSIGHPGKNNTKDNKARITLTYTDYRINIGIPDAIFSKKSQKK